MKTPHKHCEKIKAWAEGYEIEQRITVGDDNLRYCWFVDSAPKWDDERVYRVKSEPKPDIVRYYLAVDLWGCAVAESGDNIKITFDGETGELIKAERCISFEKLSKPNA